MHLKPNSNKIVFVMPEPSPFGGMKAISKMYYDRKIFDNEEYIHFDSVFQADSRLKKLTQSFRLRYRFAKMLRNEKPAGVYIYTSSYMGFYDKAVYCLLCRVYGIKSSLNIVGGEFFKFYKSSVINKLLVKLCLKLPHTIVVGSKEWHNIFIKEFSPKNLALIYNPVIPTTKPKEKHNFIEGKVNFLFFSRLSKPKGIVEVVSLLKKIDHKTANSIVFTIAGKGEEADFIRAELKDEIEKGVVEFYENVSDEEKEALMFKANVFVLPSYAEVLPISLLEAMSNRMPAIVTSVGGMPDAVIEGENGLLIQNINAIEEELEKHIMFFISNKEAIDVMGEQSYKKVMSQFSFDVVFNSSVSTFN